MLKMYRKIVVKQWVHRGPLVNVRLQPKQEVDTLKRHELKKKKKKMANKLPEDLH